MAAGIRAYCLAALTALAIATLADEATAQGERPAAAGSPAPTAYPGGKWEPGPARYGMTVMDDIPVTMDDGVVLRASVAWPTDLATGKRAAGKFPVVIEHTPYVKLGQPVVPNRFLTEHGYIYAVVRARGTGASGGEVENFSARDGADGKTLADWAAQRIDGSDGRVALLGCSYPAGLALTDTAALGPNSPVKVVIAACVGLGASYREAQMNAGMLTAGIWNYAVRGLAYWGNSPAGARFMDAYTKNIMAGGDMAYDRAYWHEHTSMAWARRIAETRIPVLLWSGWGDILEGSAMRTYTALQNAQAGRAIDLPLAPGQRLSGRYQIILGNWAHADGLDAGIYLQWLETWLKGVDTGIGTTATPMHAYEPGTERWVNLAGFPAVPQATVWQLGASQTLERPAPQRGGTEKLIWGDPAVAGSKLSFTTPALAQGATLSGPISATIYASSSNTNLQLLAHLYDVAPDGTATLISDGAIMGSLRELDRAKSWTDRRGTIVWPWPRLERDTYLKPGAINRFDVALNPRQWGINPNHRLRLELTTQSSRAICPATGLPPRNVPDPCRLTAPQQATVPGGVYTIMLGGRTPSVLNLPQLPYKAFAEARSGIPPTGWSESQRRIRDAAKGDTLFSLPLDWGH